MIITFTLLAGLLASALALASLGCWWSEHRFRPAMIDLDPPEAP